MTYQKKQVLGHFTISKISGDRLAGCKCFFNVISFLMLYPGHRLVYCAISNWLKTSERPDLENETNILFSRPLRYFFSRSYKTSLDRPTQVLSIWKFLNGVTIIDYEQKNVAKVWSQQCFKIEKFTEALKKKF